MRYWKLLGEYNAESTTYSEFAGTGRTSPYSPQENARLVGLRPILNRAAATTLINHVQIKLTCSTFKPNSIECSAQGSGLQTAPALSGGVNSHIDFECDQPVQAGVPITLEGKNISETDTPVTVSCLLYGLFDNGGG